MKLLVKARQGYGYNLPTQKVYVSGRPYIVEKSAETSVGEVQKNIVVLASNIPDSMTDEKFHEQYMEDADKAIEKVVKLSKASDKAMVEIAKREADEAAEAKAKQQKELAAEIKRQEQAEIEDAERQAKAEAVRKAAKKAGK